MQAPSLKEFKAIPKDGRPISEWTNKNTAWLDVITELRRLVQFSAPPGESEKSSDAPRAARAAAPATSRYRVKQTFDQVDRDDYRRAAFETIRRFFERSCEELDGVEGLRGRYESMGPGAFTCTAVNGHIKSGRGNGLGRQDGPDHEDHLRRRRRLAMERGGSGRRQSLASVVFLSLHGPRR